METKKIDNKVALKISINIWDDYCEDDFLKGGEIQKTYAYVECDEINQDSKEQVLTAVFDYMNEYIKIQDEGVEIKLFFHDSFKENPSLIGTEHEWCLYKRWQINFKHLTHKRLEKLLKELNDASFEIEGIPFEFYSES